MSRGGSEAADLSWRVVPSDWPKIGILTRLGCMHRSQPSILAAYTERLEEGERVVFCGSWLLSYLQR